MTLRFDRPVELYRRIVLIRRFEEAVISALRAGEIPGAVHCSIGQEGTIVGACQALRDDDFVIGTHRSHGHPIAKGAPLAPLMAELMGKRTGVCKGRGGSMHLAHLGVGVVGASGIVGGGIPLATGAGLSIRVRGTDQVALCFFGDGASNAGTFHESLNMASIWNLPVVYVCENNRYGATTPNADVSAVEDIAERASSYAMPGKIVDGQDVFAVHGCVLQAVQRARRGEGPSLIEAKTYRYREHAEGLIIPVAYRDSEEVERWKERDPLEICRERLLAEGLLDAAGATAIEQEVGEQVRAAAEFARESESPEPADAHAGLFRTPPPGSPQTDREPSEGTRAGESDA